jgi:hypothetical protein
VSGQLHARAALSPGKIPRYPLDRRLGGQHGEVAPRLMGEVKGDQMCEEHEEWKRRKFVEKEQRMRNCSVGALLKCI